VDHKLLIDRLLADELVTETEIGLLNQNEEYRHLPVEQAMVEDGLIEEAALLKIMSDVYGLPLTTLTADDIDSELADSLPAEFLKNCWVFPLKALPEEETQPLAMADPFDVSAIDAVRYLTGKRVRRLLTSRADIRRALRGDFQTGAAFENILDKIPEKSDIEYVHRILEDEASERAANEAPIIQLVDSIIADAIRLKASDIHVEAMKKFVRVRYRVDGMLRTVSELPKHVQGSCTARFKLIAGIDIAETRRPQDGRSRVRQKNREIDLRVSTIPTFFGEKVVIRILDHSDINLTLEKLGFDTNNLKLLKQFLMCSQGLILITGPTGSGKTSTLYSALKVLNTEEVNIVTVEDPVEYQLEGINQTQVAVKTGVTFARTLRSILRQDPDIVMVGEIRDLETAEIVVQAAQTGHLVLSTLHTNDAPSSLTRLVLMGLEPYMVAGSLLCVMAQRLVRKLCTKCRYEVELEDVQREMLDHTPEQVYPSKLFRSDGCKHCHHLGYSGRLALFELLPMTERLRREMLQENNEERLWRKSREDGMQTLLEDGIQKVEAGLTSLDEVLRVVTLHRTSQFVEPNTEESAPEREQQLWRPPLQIKDVMSSDVILAKPDMLAKDLVRLFVEKGISGSPVVDDSGKAIGTVSYTDVAVFSQFPDKQVRRDRLRVEDIMSHAVYLVHPNETLTSAEDTFRRFGVHRLVVADGTEICGILTPLDIFREPHSNGTSTTAKTQGVTV
jgi:type IV pilus assembly protein PilB